MKFVLLCYSSHGKTNTYGLRCTRFSRMHLGRWNTLVGVDSGRVGDAFQWETSQNMMAYVRGQQAFSVQGRIVNIVGVVGQWAKPRLLCRYLQKS